MAAGLRVGAHSLRRATIFSVASFAMLAAPLPRLCAIARAQIAEEPPSIASPTPVIDRITIVRENVFNSEEKHAGILGDSTSLNEYSFGSRLRLWTGPHELDIAGWANRIHFKTQLPVIERELLFKEGQPLRLSLLKETERNLRSLVFLRDASVTERLTDPEHAEVTVLTQDAWTLDPLLGFSTIGGGHLVGEAGISESNLFGFGKQAEAYFSSERYRNVDFIGYEDPRVLGTHWHLVAQGSEDSDGRTRSVLLEDPFWSLEVPDSIGGSVSDVSDQERLFSQDGNLLRHWQTAATFDAEHALVAEQDLVRRIGVRYQLWDDSFAPPPSGTGTPAYGLEPRRTSAPELTFTEWHPDFVKAYYLDELGHPEDRDVGWAVQTRLGYSPVALGASRSEFVMGTSASFGVHHDDTSYGWLRMQVSGREGAGQIRDGFLTLEGIGYQRLGDLFDRKQTLVLDARTDLSSGLFRDHEFVIGSDDGNLRGYPINYLAGTQRMQFHVEDRVTLVEDLMHLMSLGVAGFADAGQVWGRGRALSDTNMLASVGVGLRLAGTRGIQIPVRLDFAIALFHHRGVSDADFSDGVGQEFGTFGQPYASESNSIADPENLAPDSQASPYPNASPFTYPGNSFIDF
jgi:surface antigen Omp85-like protein